jgi:hypothetical protein
LRENPSDAGWAALSIATLVSRFRAI